MSNTTTELSLDLQRALKKIRARLRFVYGLPQYDGNPCEWQRDMVPLFPRWNNWFPGTKVGNTDERSFLRHQLLSAFLGRPIASQYEVTVSESKVIKEVLHDQSQYLTRSVANELEEAVQGPNSLEPWNILEYS